MNCPHCNHTLPLAAIPDSDLQSEVGRRRQAKQKRHAGGRKPKPSPCPGCGAECPTAVEARAHCQKPRSAKGYLRV